MATDHPRVLLDISVETVWALEHVEKWMLININTRLSSLAFHKGGKSMELEKEEKQAQRRAAADRSRHTGYRGI